MGRSCSPIDDMTRSTSPLHFLHPVAHCSHHQQRASAAAAADISRLLDPAYLPSSSSRPAVKAYLDPQGDLHDPDYRHFPISAPAYSHSHSHSHFNQPKRRGTSPRPHFDWEMDLDEHALDDEYDEEDSFSKNHHMSPRLQYPTTASSSRSWSSSAPSSTRPRDSSFSTTSRYSANYYSPTGTASTLPTSYEDDSDLHAESPFEEKKKGRRLSKGEKEKERMIKALEKEREEEAQREEAEREKERAQELREAEERRRSMDYIDLTPSPRRISRTYGRSRRALDLYDDNSRPEDEDDEDDSAHLHPNSSDDSSEFVPTCSQSLKRQWQALSLSLRFSMFRAQRRVMNRVASLTT